MAIQSVWLTAFSRNDFSGLKKPKIVIFGTKCEDDAKLQKKHQKYGESANFPK